MAFGRIRHAILLPCLVLSACGGRLADGLERGGIECAPYARQVSGIQLAGAADGWWRGAEGRYARSGVPEPGGVLVFRRSDRLPYGHVSVVSQVVSPRSILVTQANWVHGRIARSEPVLDVSPGNDWTAVRVWWAPVGAMGSTVYPAYGFVQPRPPVPGPAPLAASPYAAGRAG